MSLRRFRPRLIGIALVALMGLTSGPHALAACERIWLACQASCCVGESSRESSEGFDGDGEDKSSSPRARAAIRPQRPRPSKAFPVERSECLACRAPRSAASRRIPHPFAATPTPLYIQVSRLLN